MNSTKQLKVFYKMQMSLFKPLIGKALSSLGSFEKEIIEIFDENQKRFQNEFFVLMPRQNGRILYVPATLNDNIVTQETFIDENNLLKKFFFFTDSIEKKVRKDVPKYIIPIIEDEDLVKKLENTVLSMYVAESVDYCFVCRKIDEKLYIAGAEISEDGIFIEKGREMLSNYLTELLTGSL